MGEMIGEQGAAEPDDPVCRPLGRKCGDLTLIETEYDLLGRSEETGAKCFQKCLLCGPDFQKTAGPCSSVVWKDVDLLWVAKRGFTFKKVFGPSRVLEIDADGAAAGHRNKPEIIAVREVEVDRIERCGQHRLALCGESDRDLPCLESKMLTEDDAQRCPINGPEKAMARQLELPGPIQLLLVQALGNSVRCDRVSCHNMDGYALQFHRGAGRVVMRFRVGKRCFTVAAKGSKRVAWMAFVIIDRGGIHEGRIPTCLRGSPDWVLQTG